jgi:hypothetical protein
MFRKKRTKSKLKPNEIKVRIKSYDELDRLGFIYSEQLGNIVLYNGNGVWKTIDAYIFKEQSIIIPNKRYYFYLDDYEIFKDIFEVLEQGE